MKTEAAEESIAAEFYALIERLKPVAVSRVAASAALDESLAQAFDQRAERGFVDAKSFAEYVYEAAYNLLRAGYHEQQPRANYDGRIDPDWPMSTTPIDDLADEDRLRRMVANAVAELPEQDRKVVTLFYIEEESKAEICAALGLTPLHFDKVVFRARRRMRRLFEVSELSPRMMLKQEVERILQESGRLQNFNVDSWLDEWLAQRLPAIGNERPADFMNDRNGDVRILVQVLACAQSGSFM